MMMTIMMMIMMTLRKMSHFKWIGRVGFPIRLSSTSIQGGRTRRMERVTVGQEGNRRGAREQAISSQMTRGRASQGWHSPGFLVSHPAFQTSATSPGLLASSSSPARPQQPPTKAVHIHSWHRQVAISINNNINIAIIVMYHIMATKIWALLT